MKKFSAILLILVVAVAAQAASVEWNGTTGNWTDAGSWAGGVIPGAGDSPRISHVDEHVIVTSSDDITTGLTLLGRYSDGGYATLEVDGGSINITDDFYIGSWEGRYTAGGILEVKNGGSVTASGLVTAGKYGPAHIKMSSGSIDFTGEGMWFGRLNTVECTMDLAGGVLTTAHLYNNVSSTNPMSINVHGGELRVAGDHSVTFDNWKTDGILYSDYGDETGEINISYDGEYTSVTSVPEPATVALLGLGMVMLRKRK